VAAPKALRQAEVGGAAARSSDEMESHTAPADDSYGGSGGHAGEARKFPTKIFPF